MDEDVFENLKMPWSSPAGPKKRRKGKTYEISYPANAFDTSILQKSMMIHSSRHS